MRMRRRSDAGGASRCRRSGPHADRDAFIEASLSVPFDWQRHLAFYMLRGWPACRLIGLGRYAFKLAGITDGEVFE